MKVHCIIPAVLLLLAFTVNSGVADEQMHVGLADGELPFRLRAFSFPAEGDSSRLLMLATLRADRLHWESSDSLRASLEIEWEIHALGDSRGSKRESLHFAKAPGLSRIDGQVLVTAEWTLPAGHYRLEFSAEDPGRKVGGLFGMLGRLPYARWSGRVQAREYSEGGFSDILLYTVGADSLSRPNPWSSFVEGAPFLEIYSVLRAPRGEGDWFSLTLDLEDSSGEQILQKRGGWKHEGRPFPLRLRIPMAGLEAGDYSLSLTAGGPGLSSDTQYEEFQILPRVRGTDEQRLMEKVQAGLLLDDDNFRSWESLPPAQRSDLLRRTWEQLDPDPREHGNPLRDEFLRRYKKVRQRFGGFQPGPLTDRGRLWILLGEPDEILVDVLPENKASLHDAIIDLHGNREGSEINPALERDLGKAGLGGPGSPGVESEAFEMWIYRFGGDPLIPGIRLNLREIDLKLIFVDRSGTGEYMLEFSSEKFDF